MDITRPWMEDTDIKLIQDLLLGLGKRTIDVLEWGSGGSTIFFTAFLRHHEISYRWLSLEYNRAWYERVAQLARSDPGIQIVLFDVGNNILTQRNTDMTEYVLYPATLDRKFDFILVDGRKRRRCLLEAAKLLASGGAVALHDAERTYYHCAFAAFPKGEFLSTKMWAGRI